MLEIIFLITIGLIWILFASIHDIKKNEIANWLSFSLIIFVMSFRFFFSFFLQDNFNFFYQGLIGLGIFFIIGNLLYYLRLFAGGDGKLMISMGTLLPFSQNTNINLELYLIFIIILLFIGAIYGLLFSIILGIKNFKILKKEFPKQIKKNKKYINYLMIFIILLLISSIYIKIFFYIGLFLFILIYLFIYTKIIDEKCMIKKQKTENLVEGDWLYEEVKINKNKTIKPNWQGLTTKQIKQIQKTKKQVKIRNGIPFIPVFFISFIIYIILWLLNINLLKIIY